MIHNIFPVVTTDRTQLEAQAKQLEAQAKQLEAQAKMFLGSE